MQYYAQVKNRLHEVESELNKCATDCVASTTRFPVDEDDQTNRTFDHEEWLEAEQRELSKHVGELEKIVSIDGNVCYSC